MTDDLLSKMELHRRRNQLLARIRRRYDIVEQTYEIGPLRVPFTRVKDADVVLDQVCDEVDRIEKNTGRKVPDQLMHMPYWAELWDSAFGIGQWLVGRVQGSGFRVRDRVQGSGFGVQESNDASAFPEPRTPNPEPSLTLDLGCGMGFAGVVSAILGDRVVFADLESQALLFAELNSLPWTHRVQCRKLNWQKDRLDERFGLIIGADVLYERSQWEFLEPFFRRHLKQGGSVLLGEPGRQTGDLFGDWIRARGWNLQMHEEKVDTRERPIRLFELRISENEERRNEV